MKQEDKELLLQDLCGRLPYGVKMNHVADDEYSPNTLIGIAKNMITLEGLGGYECVDIEHYRSYLFPLSSMTVAQRNEFIKTLLVSDGGLLKVVNVTIETYDWLNKNHFDSRGLIEKGLAIDCTNLNIY